MSKKTISDQSRRQLVERSTKASARLEQRVVPADHKRSEKIEEFVDSLRLKM